MDAFSEDYETHTRLAQNSNIKKKFKVKEKSVESINSECVDREDD